MPLKEITTASPYVETSATAACNQFTSLSGQRCGTDNYGWSGASFQLLKKNGTGGTPPLPFDNSVGIYANAATGGGVAQAKANAAAEGAKFYVPGVYFNQGETEMNGTITATTYKGYMAQLQSDYQTDINAVTGQTGLVPLFIVQKSSWAAWGSARTTPTTTSGGLDGVPIGQLQAALDGYSTGKIFITGPDYATSYAADGVHKPAVAYRTQGGIEGKVMHQVTVERKPWRPFYPRSITLSGTLLRVRFWVPVPPLVFDETAISPLPDGFKGFELTDTGGTGRTITGVALTSGQTDSVDITLSGIPVSTVELRYAWTAAGTGASYAGPTNGPRGNVADSDTRTSVQGDPLRDYALTFRIPGISVAAPFAWEPADPNLGSIAPAKTMSNAVTVHNLASAAQTSRTWAVHRYFADKEICGQPQPYTAGAGFTYWQADVTSRWPADGNCAGGYARTAMISWEATIVGSSAQVVEFRASANGCNLGSVATCLAAGMGSSDMLNFNAGGGVASWGLKVSATTGGITKERSARTMIAASQYQILKNGPLFTEVLVREGPQSVAGLSERWTSFGWHCTSGCTAPYDTATWEDNGSWDSIRPTFLLRFYRRWGRVEGDSILQNAWMDRHVDQRMDSYAVLHGPTESAACYTAPAPVVIPGRSTVWDGPCWSTDPADATNTRVDLNAAYIVYSKAVPEYDPDRGVGAAARDLELNTSAAQGPTGIGWNNTDKGATTTASITPHLGWGQWQPLQSAGGGGHWVAPLPRGSARYLLSMENSMLEVVMGGARAFLHWPISHLSPLTSTFWTGYGRTSFGQPISLLSHPGFRSRTSSSSVPLADSLTDPSGTRVLLGCATCMVQCQSTSGSTLEWCSTTSTNGVNKFGYDLAHTPNPFYVPWLVTGKQFLTEGLWHQAAWASAYFGPTSPMTNEYQSTRVGSVGYVYELGQGPRSLSWTLRQKALATVATPDVQDAEKAYFGQMVSGALEIDEGRMGITNGAYPPPDPANGDGRYGCANKSSWLASDSLWCLGRYYFDQGRVNALGTPHWSGASSAPWSCRSCRLDVSNGALTPWMEAYSVNIYGFLMDLGFPAAKPFDRAAKWMMGLFFDSGGINGPMSASYHTPSRNADGTAYLQSWAAVASGRNLTARVGRTFDATAASFRIANAVSASQADGGWNSTDLYEQDTIIGKVGSELFGMSTAADATVAMTVDAAIDTASVTSHSFVTGDLVRVRRASQTYTGATDELSVADGGTMCLYGKNDCDFYVEVIGPTELKFYLDSARTQVVDWTAADPGMLVGQSIVTIYGGGGNYACGNAVCRGLQGTAAAAHAVGEVFSMTNAVLSAAKVTPTLGVQSGHGANFYAALANAAERGTTITDSITGKVITGARAFETYRRWFYGIHYFGGRTSCTGLTTYNCDNPMYGFKPRGTPGNVRLVGSNLLYTAPDGAACRYAVSAAPFASTDDSSDTASISGPRARSIPLASGAWHYRISCGVTGRVTGQATAP